MTQTAMLYTRGMDYVLKVVIPMLFKADVHTHAPDELIDVENRSDVQ